MTAKLAMFENSILAINGNFNCCAFESETRQLLDDKEFCYVYYKDEQKLFKISFDTYIKLLLKLERLVWYHEKCLRINERSNIKT